MARILIVDGDEETRELVSLGLRFAGHEVLIVANSVEAHKLVKLNRPDLILMSVNLPGMQMGEFNGTLMIDIRTASIPLLLLSNKSEEFTLPEELESLIAGTIIKPISPDMVTKQVNHILKSSGKH